MNTRRSIIADSELLPPFPSKTKLRRYLFLLIVLGLSLYLLLPQVARIEQAFRVAFSLKMPIVAFSLGAQILSYLGSGYLLRAVVGLVQKTVSCGGRSTFDRRSQ